MQRCVKQNLFDRDSGHLSGYDETPIRRTRRSPCFMASGTVHGGGWTCSATPWTAANDELSGRLSRVRLTSYHFISLNFLPHD